MTFTSLKENAALQKTTLINMSVKRYLNDEATVYSGSVYSISAADEDGDLLYYTAIAENGAAYTEVASYAAVNAAKKFYLDKSAKVLYFRPTSAPSSTFAIVGTFWLNYSNRSGLYVAPFTGSSDLVLATDRIQGDFTVSHSIKNIIYGHFSISSSLLVLNNTDNHFQQFLGGDYSLYNNEVNIKVCLNSTSDSDNWKQVYKGAVTSISYTDRDLELALKDPFSSLESLCLMGNTSDYAYYNTTEWPDLDPRKINTPIPFVLGTRSRKNYLSYTVTGYSGNARVLDPDALIEGVCKVYSPTISTTTNRFWMFLRANVNGFPLTAYQISDVTHSGTNYSRVTLSGGDISMFAVGMAVSINKSGTFNALIVDIDYVNLYIYTTYFASGTGSGGAIYTNPATIVITDGTTRWYIYDDAYTVGALTTNNSNYILQIQFNNNFEASYSGLTALDPTRHRVCVMYVGPNVVTHGELLKDMLGYAGISSNATTFSNVDAEFTAQVVYQMPNIFESDFSPYYKYIEDVLYSTFGYLYLDDDFLVNYALINTPSSTDSVTDYDILTDSFAAQIKYEDISDQIISYNPHFADSDALASMASDSPSQTSTSYKAKYLHGINNIKKHIHCLDRGSRIASIANILHERFLTTKTKLKTKFMEKNIGDDVLINRNGMVNQQHTIIGIDKNENDITLTTTDFYNV